jgi:RNA polymerase sigma-70 factor (ECF subfamily)
MTRAPFACTLNAWHAHHAEIKAYLIHRLADPALADHVAQDVFYKAMRAGGQFCELDNPRAWLFQVARNALVDHLRRTKPLAALPEDLVAEETEVASVDALTECLDRVLAELHEDDREVIRRCDLDGLKLQAFADARGLTLPAVKSRLLRAHRRLREAMARDCQACFEQANDVCCHVPLQPT